MQKSEVFPGRFQIYKFDNIASNMCYLCKCRSQSVEFVQMLDLMCCICANAGPNVSHLYKCWPSCVEYFKCWSSCIASVNMQNPMCRKCANWEPNVSYLCKWNTEFVAFAQMFDWMCRICTNHLTECVAFVLMPYLMCRICANWEHNVSYLCKWNT